ncbi:MAG: GNAT family N-acetyltransferase [Egibacteraceae bacterium]
MSITSHQADPARALLQIVRPLYAEIYAEPPYCEGATEVDDVVSGWPATVDQPGFRLTLAHVDDEPAGFAFGFRLHPDTDWWRGLLDPLPAEEVREDGQRTFVVIELAVRTPYRRQGIGRALHETLLAHRPEKRVALLVRPEADPANAAYAVWGYRPLGRLRPFENAPLYVAMTRRLPLAAPSTTDRPDAS